MFRLRNRRGVSMILVSVLLVAFVGIAAIAVDFGRMYLFRTELHTASDASALAATLRLMVGDNHGASDTARAYAGRHWVEKSVPVMAASDVVPGTWDWSTSTFTPSPGNSWCGTEVNAVQTTAHYVANFTFGRFYGRTTRDRLATSIAAVGSVGATSCVRPWAVPYDILLRVLYPTNTPPVSYNLTTTDIAHLAQMTQADEILLKVGDASQSPQPGNFYAVREPPILYADGRVGNPWSGGNDYRDAIGAPCSALTQVIGPGDWLQAEQGNMQGPTRQGTAALCGVTGNPQSFRCTPPDSVQLAIWDISDRTIAAPNAYRVKYVGVFVVTGFQKGTGGTPDGVTGYFQTMAGSGSLMPRPGPLKKVALVR